MYMKDVFVPRVYKIINKINGHAYYGSTIKTLHDRFLDHVEDLNRQDHRNDHLQKAWNKYGEDAFEFVVLEEMPNQEEFEIRQREQWYLDNCVNWHVDYNISRSAFTNRHYASEREMKEGKYQITWEQFEEITYLLIHTDHLCATIAEKVGVSIPLVQRIYLRYSYVDLTKDMVFQKRRSGIRRKRLCEDDIPVIFNLSNQGVRAVEIAEQFQVSQDDILNVLSKRTWKSCSDSLELKRNYTRARKARCLKQYDLFLNEVAFYPDGTKHFSGDEKAHIYIQNCCRGTYGAVMYNKYVWCFKGREDTLPSLVDILFNSRIHNKKYKYSLIQYDENFQPLQEIQGLNKLTKRNKTYRNEIIESLITGEMVRGYYYRYADQVPDEDIKKLIIRKYKLDEEYFSHLVVK